MPQDDGEEAEEAFQNSSGEQWATTNPRGWFQVERGRKEGSLTLPINSFSGWLALKTRMNEGEIERDKAAVGHSK